MIAIPIMFVCAIIMAWMIPQKRQSVLRPAGREQMARPELALDRFPRAENKPCLVELLAISTPQASRKSSVAWFNLLPLSSSIVYRPYKDSKLRWLPSYRSPREDEKDLEITMVILMPSPQGSQILDAKSILCESTAVFEPGEPPSFCLGSTQIHGVTCFNYRVPVFHSSLVSFRP